MSDEVLKLQERIAELEQLCDVRKSANMILSQETDDQANRINEVEIQLIEKDQKIAKLEANNKSLASAVGVAYDANTRLESLVGVAFDAGVTYGKYDVAMVWNDPIPPSKSEFMKSVGVV